MEGCQITGNEQVLGKVDHAILFKDGMFAKPLFGTFTLTDQGIAFVRKSLVTGKPVETLEISFGAYDAFGNPIKASVEQAGDTRCLAVSVGAEKHLFQFEKAGGALEVDVDLLCSSIGSLAESYRREHPGVVEDAGGRPAGVPHTERRSGRASFSGIGRWLAHGERLGEVGRDELREAGIDPEGTPWRERRKAIKASRRARISEGASFGSRQLSVYSEGLADIGMRNVYSIRDGDGNEQYRATEALLGSDRKVNIAKGRRKVASVKISRFAFSAPMALERTTRKFEISIGGGRWDTVSKVENRYRANERRFECEGRGWWVVPSCAGISRVGYDITDNGGARVGYVSSGPLSFDPEAPMCSIRFDDAENELAVVALAVMVIADVDHPE